MKKITNLVLLLIILGNGLYAQDKYDKLAENTCECMKGTNIDNISQSDFELKLGLCILGEAAKLGIKIDANSESSMSKLGANVGAKMVVICPDLFAIMLKDNSTEKSFTEEVVEQTVIIGTITKIVKEDLMYVYIEDESGKTHKCILLENFTGAQKLIDNSTEMLNKKVEFRYEFVEYYLPRLGEFLSMKKLTALTLKY